jgi:hypothetical protein
MEIEKLIKDTFAEHEYVAPDSDEVLAATRQRIDRRRAVSRPLAVAAGVVALTLAAVTVVALNRSGDDNTQAAAPKAPIATTSAAPAEPGMPELTMPFTLGWVPPGKADHMVQRINTGVSDEDLEKPLYGGEYMFHVKNGDTTVMVDVQEFKMVSVDDATFKSGPGKSVTINGKRGIESANNDGPGGYELYLEHPEVGAMYINIGPENGGTADPETLASYGRQVAEHIEFPGTTTVTPQFGLGELPSGMRMCSFEVQAAALDISKGPLEPRTGYTIGACDSVRSAINLGTYSDRPEGDAGKPVQGHKTRILDEGGYRSLWILGAVGNEAVLISGKAPAAQLYAIADGLILPE